MTAALRRAAPVLLLLLAAAPATAQSRAELPADLAAVHPDAMGFAHVRLAEVWKSDALKDMRGLFAKAGQRAFDALDEQFVPKPSTADRVTAILLPLADANDRIGDIPGRVVGVVRFTEAFDRAAVRQSFIGGGAAKWAGGKEYFADDQTKAALHFPDDKTVLFGDDKTLAEFLTWAPKAEGGLTDAVRLAAAGKPVVVAVNIARLPIPPEATEQVPAEFQPLLKAQVLTVTMDLTKEVALTARLGFATDADVNEAEKSVKRAAEMARRELDRPRREAEEMLYGKKPEKGARPIEQLPEAVAAVAGLAGINFADELLANPPIKKEGKSLTATATLPAWATPYFGVSAVSAGLLLPAVQKVREAASRSQASNNLKQIGLAMHGYHDTFGALPPAAIVEKKGKKLLSWRVMILPFIEQDNLYKQFKLDEPWDSEHNKKLIPLMPKVYADPRVPAKPGETFYKVVVGEAAGFDWVKGRKFPGDFPDGTSNTLMTAAAGDPVVWTKPDDFEFDGEKVPDLSRPFPVILIGMFDGSVRTLSPKLPVQTLKWLIMRNDGMVIPDFE